MKVIVDNMVAHQVLLSKADPDYKYVRRKLELGELKLVYGGKLLTEYFRSQKIRIALRVFDQLGIAQVQDDENIKSEARVIRGLGVCRSDDIHIIALARVSGARLLCSNDGELHKDFKDNRLLSNPRGKVYQASVHRPLLDRYCRSCRRRCK